MANNYSNSQEDNVYAMAKVLRMLWGGGYKHWVQHVPDFKKKIEEKKLEFKDEDVLMLFKLEVIVDYNY